MYDLRSLNSSKADTDDATLIEPVALKDQAADRAAFSTSRSFPPALIKMLVAKCLCERDHRIVVVPKDRAPEQAVNRLARPLGRFADFSEIGVHTCLCLKFVGRRGGGLYEFITDNGL